MSKLDIHLIALSFDELIQQQINKYYHYKHTEDDEDDENHFDEEQKLTKKFNQLHDEHVLWLKKKKKNAKIIGPIIERFRMFYYRLDFKLFSIFFRGTLRSFTGA